MKAMGIHNILLQGWYEILKTQCCDMPYTVHVHSVLYSMNRSGHGLINYGISFSWTSQNCCTEQTMYIISHWTGGRPSLHGSSTHTCTVCPSPMNSFETFSVFFHETIRLETPLSRQRKRHRQLIMSEKSKKDYFLLHVPHTCT